MKRVSLFLILSLMFSVAAGENATRGNVNIFLGSKQTLDNSWAPFDEQAELAVLFDVQPQGWPLSVAIDMMVSAYAVDYGGNIRTVSTSELDFGIRKVFDPQWSAFHPYVGGGLGLISARDEYDWGIPPPDEGRTIGAWLGGGLFITLSEHFNLGFDLRHSHAEVKLRGNTQQAGGIHAGVLLGYHW